MIKHETKDDEFKDSGMPHQGVRLPDSSAKTSVMEMERTAKFISHPRFPAQYGLAEGRAREIVGELFSGHARWLEQSGESFGELQDQVTSRGGVMERALEYLPSHGFEQHSFVP